MRRSSHQHTALSYGEVGATQAVDLMDYPPAGFTPEEYRTRIGHGDERFAAACEQALTWQIQKRSGIEVQIDEIPPADESTYRPVSFDEQGNPVARAEPAPAEQPRTADGEPLVTPGTTATLLYPLIGRLRMRAPVRVVYVVDEVHRKGLALGTMHGHPLCGEESWVIEQTDDGSVWISVRLFWRPATWQWRLAYPALWAARRLYTRRYLGALLGPAEPSAATDAARSDPPADDPA